MSFSDGSTGSWYLVGNIHVNLCQPFPLRWPLTLSTSFPWRHVVWKSIRTLRLLVSFWPSSCRMDFASLCYFKSVLSMAGLSCGGVFDARGRHAAYLVRSSLLFCGDHLNILYYCFTPSLPWPGAALHPVWVGYWRSGSSIDGWFSLRAVPVRIMLCVSCMAQ